LAGELRKKEGVLIDAERALTRSYSPLRAALTSYLPPPHDSNVYTCILDAAKGRISGFAQIQWRPDAPSAKVIYLAPSLTETDEAPSIWRRLLAYLCVKAGERGIQCLLASLPEEGPEAEIFQQVGFSPYAQEEILRLERIPSPQCPSEMALRRQRAADGWNLRRLCLAATPTAVQRAEGNSGDWLGRPGGKGYVLEEDGELVGYLCITEGERGYWLRVLLHPQAHERAMELVEQTLALLANLPPRPIYCGLRSYQGWLSEPLQEKGFRPFAHRLAVAKRIAVYAREPATRPIPALQRKAEALTTMRFGRK